MAECREKAGGSAIRGSVVMIQTVDGTSTSIEQSEDAAMAFFETRDLDFGDPFTLKFIKRVFTVITGKSDLPEMNLIVKARNDLSSPLVTLGTFPLDDILEPVKMFTKKFRYFRFRWQDDSVKVPWAFYGFSIYGEVGGRRF